METFCLFVIFGSILSLCSVRVLGAPTVAPNLAEDIAILKNKVSDKGSNVAEQLAKSPKKTKTKTVRGDNCIEWSVAIKFYISWKWSTSWTYIIVPNNDAFREFVREQNIFDKHIIFLTSVRFS